MLLTTKSEGQWIQVGDVRIRVVWAKPGRVRLAIETDGHQKKTVDEPNSVHYTDRHKSDETCK